MGSTQPHPAAYIAFTAPINPTGVTPVLSRAQIWQGLRRKVRHAEEFVGGAIKSTDVIEVKTDDHGREVVVRDVVFAEEGRKAREICTAFEDMKVEFLQTNGTRVLNTVSDGAEGELYMTYQFEWFMAPDTSAEQQAQNVKKWKAMAKTAVEHSIVALREMVQDGRIDKLD